MPGQATLTINDNQWNVWVASTISELTTGLSGRESIPAGTGMLFVLPVSQAVTVDTSQMLFAIDIIFIADGIVVGVASDIQPGYQVTEETPCDMFLEVNAGEAADVGVGDTLNLEITQEPGIDFSSIMFFAIPVAVLGFVSAIAGGVMKLAGGSSESKARSLPQTRKRKALPEKTSTGERGKPSRHNVQIGAWAERDRIGIWITDKRTGKTVAEWWDEDAQEMFEQGWFKPGDIRHQTITGRAFEESVLNYAESVGLLGKNDKYLPQTVRHGYYWTVVNKDTGEIVESFTPYTGSRRALRGGKAWASRHWPGDKSLVEVWEQPHRYSEKLKIAPLASETVAPPEGAVVPTEPRPCRGSGPASLEFLPDSPEFLAFTIDDIGYREKLDTAFQQAIARTRRGR